jgi:hypothetical protein
MHDGRWRIKDERGRTEWRTALRAELRAELKRRLLGR